MWRVDCERLERNEAELSHEIGGEEGVAESVPPEDNLVASGQLIDAVEYLIPAVFRHQADERIQPDDSLLVEVVKNAGRDGIDFCTFPSYRMNFRI